MPVFKVGSPVFLTNTALRKSVGIGTVLRVIPSEGDSSDPALYDVDFASGLRRLHASELRAALFIVKTDPFSILYCGEKERLRTAHLNALDIYVTGVTTMAEAVGVIAHSEFDLVKRNVDVAKQYLEETRERLNTHIFTHGC